ncbi:hypothetical protein [Cellulomonas alba]|uniref:Uncharacterized protein n=1 Tax=Cellulomonas alba TaxID=3053467 RepID=A0ABT7SCY2_9CELL|nr:hypothetical protein [Cellulomonas alba]MDM7853996.1 hypothetical protein [Cellulomonas alba]
MVLASALVVLLAVAGVASSRWVLRRYDALGRRRPFPTITVAVALGLAVACAVPLWLHDRLEHRLSAVAGGLVGAPVTVHCQTPSETFVHAGGELGYVRWDATGVPEHSTVLAYDACRDLRRWLGSDKRRASLDEVVAVHVLTHESMHMAGLLDESRAECAAVQRDARTAMALGATRDEAVALARQYWTQAYPRMPDGYRSGCGAGGEHDEHLPLAPWDVGGGP